MKARRVLLAWIIVACCCSGLLLVVVGGMEAAGQAAPPRTRAALNVITPPSGALSVSGTLKPEVLMLMGTTPPSCTSAAGVARTYRWDSGDDRMEACLQVGGAWQWVPLAARLSATATVDAPNLVALACDTQSFSPASLANVTTSYLVKCGPLFDLGAGGTYICWMSATGQVSVKVCNIAALASLNPPSGTFAFEVDL